MNNINITETKKKMAVMDAYCLGKQIQHKFKGSDLWEDCFDPIWDFKTREYRVKPENVSYYPEDK